ncbi:hypothetical protein [Ekhidna sp.]
MKNIFFTRILVFVLCFSMMAEISVSVINQDVISIEADTEIEHEEGSEKGKEKHASNRYLYLQEIEIMPQLAKITSYKDWYWNTPSLDFQTPPPKLC